MSRPWKRLRLASRDDSVHAARAGACAPPADNPQRMTTTSLLYAAAGILLVLLNGFFVAAEFARTKALLCRVLLAVRSNLDAYLCACQLGITAAALGLCWMGEPAFAR